jgi:hypothetical protein
MLPGNNPGLNSDIILIIIALYDIKTIQMKPDQTFSDTIKNRKKKRPGLNPDAFYIN